MITRELTRLDKQLRKATYEEIDEALSPLDSVELLALMDSASIKVGDTAADWLWRRGEHRRIVDAVQNGTLHTRLGKIRATNVLAREGRRLPDGLATYAGLLEDRSEVVAANALLKIVLWGDKAMIPNILSRKAKLAANSQLHAEFDKAVEALEKSDPAIFAPNFRDPKGVWKT